MSRDTPPGWFTLAWRDGAVVLLDQRRLPAEEHYLELRDVESLARAIEDLAVRGAPAIGCTAALGVVLAARASAARGTALDQLAGDVSLATARLGKTRPTAVNLFWALGRMQETLGQAAREAGATVEGVCARLEQEALQLVAEDVEACRAIGRHGLALVPQGARILTHCNAGALATAGYGTALGVVRAAWEAGRGISVLADETRPFLQGARLTAWELARDGIPVSVHTDSMAGHLMQTGAVDLIVVGADRIAANGDVANKVGTYPLSLLAREHAVPFYVAAPLSTLDMATPNGAAIPIEERGRSELASFGARAVLPDGVPVRHPAFDVTPAALVTAIVTERGVTRPPYAASLRALSGE